MNKNSKNDSLQRKKLKQAEDDLRSYVQKNRNMNAKKEKHRENHKDTRLMFY